MEYPLGKIIQFAKAPVAGTVKTRLQPLLGKNRALQLHKELMSRVLSRCVQSKVGSYELSVAGDSGHVFFGTFADYALTISEQRGNNLGQRMANAISDALQTYPFAIVIGSDCPVMDAEYIETACAALSEGAEVVIGPAEDGGYVLIGMRVLEPGIFQDIDWGTGQVLEQTRRRLHRYNINWMELPVLWDVDRPEDFDRFNRLVC